MSESTSSLPSTLEEPVWKTILTELQQIGVKLFFVLVPINRKVNILAKWDLWGPLVLCMTFAMFLSFNAPSGQGDIMFATGFFIVWIGAVVVTVNAIILGSNISIFQSVCLLGYCIAPLVLAEAINTLLGLVGLDIIFIKLVVTFISFVWSTFAALSFFFKTVEMKKVALVLYPVILFFLAIAWLILVC
ncbi:Yip1 domain [Carpediemonas membranifera]|uniref:Protein YIPF n=1 Tax=Carpediemonas membranifera TaxID=201153 RepID=A0A8J6DZ63_9EUKA|nr:Yip1 domain [Carpediemonas membranifera]|eukprot:KAG9393204.1 Yip1 domain [Carpediemonas membranifera]